MKLYQCVELERKVTNRTRTLITPEWVMDMGGWLPAGLEILCDGQNDPILSSLMAAYCCDDKNYSSTGQKWTASVLWLLKNNELKNFCEMLFNTDFAEDPETHDIISPDWVWLDDPYGAMDYSEQLQSREEWEERDKQCPCCGCTEHDGCPTCDCQEVTL